MCWTFSGSPFYQFWTLSPSPVVNTFFFDLNNSSRVQHICSSSTTQPYNKYILKVHPNMNRYMHALGHNTDRGLELGDPCFCSLLSGRGGLWDWLSGFGSASLRMKRSLIRLASKQLMWIAWVRAFNLWPEIFRRILCVIHTILYNRHNIQQIEQLQRLYRRLGLHLDVLDVVESYPHTVVHPTPTTSEPLKMLLPFSQYDQPGSNNRKLQAWSKIHMYISKFGLQYK